MKLGARVFKTGLAITVSLYTAIYFNLEFASIAAIAATFAIQPSVYRSWLLIWDNLLSNAIGGAVAIITALFLGASPIVVGVAVILTICAHLAMNKKETIPISVVTVIAIMAWPAPPDAFFLYALDRLSLVVIGVLSAVIVNFIFIPPQYETKLYNQIINQTTELFKWTRLILQHAPEHNAVKETGRKLEKERSVMEEYYLWLKEEREITKTKHYAKQRRIVVLRQMIRTTELLENLFEMLYQHEHEYQSLPHSIRIKIEDAMENLTAIHERILLRVNGKMRNKDHKMYAIHSFQYPDTLTKAFIDYYQKHGEESVGNMHLLPMIATIIDYGRELERLDKLIDQFQTFHTEANQFSLSQKSV